MELQLTGIPAAELEVERVGVEASFLDVGDRRSGTLPVTAERIDVLTEYPRDLESLTIAA